MQLGSQCGMGRIAWVAGLPGVVLATAMIAWTRPGTAAAGIEVTNANGRIEFGASGGLGEPNARDFTATVPGSETVNYNGDVGGVGQVTYDVSRTTGGGLAADLTATARSTSTVGGPPVDGKSTFTLEFTSDRPLQYRYTAHLLEQGPTAFQAQLDGIQATARYDSLGETSGTIPANEAGEFGEFVREGTLPAGAHRFTIESIAFEGKAGGRSTSGAAEIRVTPVPLPPGAWTGLGVLGALAVARALRRGRGLA